MSLYAVLFAPLAIMLPAAGSLDTSASDPAIAQQDVTGAEPKGYAPPPVQVESDVEGSSFRLVAESFRTAEAQQVRIEQQMTIRISPRAPSLRPNMLMDLPGRAVGPRFAERKIGKCLKVSGIAGVQPEGGNRLLLFLRDQRIVTADLERSCRSRDFYSGFYLSRSNDGQLCVDRDMLLSRSGANCKLTRMRQLVESDD